MKAAENSAGFAQRTAKTLITVGLAVALGGSIWAQNKACALVKPAELKAALGSKPPALTAQNFPGGEGTSTCTGLTSAGSMVLLRLASQANGIGETEASGIEGAKKMGFQVEVKQFGPVTCSTMIPGPTIAGHGFNTTCSVLKNGQVAAIEVIAIGKENMVSMDKLQRVAEKMAERL